MAPEGGAGGAASDASFRVKTVSYLRQPVRIALQNINGPCPLLAIANSLILRRQLELPGGALTGGAGAAVGAPGGRDSVTATDLLHLVAGYILDRAAGAAADDPNAQQNVKARGWRGEGEEIGGGRGGGSVGLVRISFKGVEGGEGGEASSIVG